MPIDLTKLAQHEAETEFEYKGDTCKVWYRPEEVTKEFRAHTLWLNRELKLNQMHMQEIYDTVMTTNAKEGTPEFEAEDKAARQALERLKQEDKDIKHKIDAAVATIVIRWEVLMDGKAVRVFILDEEKKPVPSPELFDVPADIEGAVLTAIMADGASGEANGANSQNSSSSLSRRAARRASLRQRPRLTPISRPQNGVRR